MAGFTVRYTLYAKAHGLTPEAMREHDEKAWPGGRCAGFILWLSKAFAGVSQDVVLLLVESTEPSPAATSAATVPQGQMSLL